ncbi:MAG: hypothetical protein ABFR33_08675, partial [Verrucomicrobiota bacterium]
FDRLSDEDRRFIELASPPVFNIDFAKQSNQIIIDMGPYATWPAPSLHDYVFTAKLKQTSAGEYNHELKVELFAIGEELDGDNYILFDRQESRFTPSKENGRSHRFAGKTVRLRNYVINPKDPLRRGEKYGGYLIVVIDERGKVVAHASPYKWMFGIYEKLKVFPVGRHFDKTGTRVFPPRPKRTY